MDTKRLNFIKVALILWFMINMAHSQCCSCKFTDENTQNQLDLSAFGCRALEYIEEPYHCIYTPCGNRGNCTNEAQGITGMMIQSDPSEPYCARIAIWDNYASQPTYNSINEEWTLVYENGDDCFAAPTKFTTIWRCNEHIDDYVIDQFMEPVTCQYVMVIETKYACPGRVCINSTTTSVPIGECEWRSIDDVHILNISSLIGVSLSIQDKHGNDNYYYVYTPCQNTIRCDDNIWAMTYFFDVEEFQCKKYFAIWENGINEPSYNEELQIWQFFYTNGESCGGLQMLFVINWYCDLTASTSQIINAEQDAECVYIMNINSTLACG